MNNQLSTKVHFFQNWQPLSCQLTGGKPHLHCEPASSVEVECATLNVAVSLVKGKVDA